MAAKLKIGIVVDDTLDKPDGVQQYVIGIGEWLRHQGHEVHYLAGESTRTDLANVHSLSRNLKVRFNGNRLSIPLPTSKKRLKNFLEQEQFDILHVQMPYSPFMAARLVNLAGDTTAVFGTFHILPNSSFVSFTSKLLGIWLRKSLKRFDSIFSVSSAAQTFAKASFGIDSTVLPNVFDYHTFHDAKPFPDYDDATATILFLGRLVPRKGCQTLLEAAHILMAEHPELDFRLVICGKGPLSEKLQAYTQAHHLSDRTTFTGFVHEADKPRYYASSDITVFPSNGGESFGIVLLEAMASGKAAVLAGDNPGYRSVMTPQPELLFKPDNPKLLADVLHTYLTDKKAADKARHWGEDYVKQFDTDVVGKKLLSAYGQALRKRREQ